uniref:non-specific serine/threonine protein kinase n=1 Tax=Gopherus evgoodei TaxID=1825980 RepID=A0A8C4VGP4_9SAUR
TTILSLKTEPVWLQKWTIKVIDKKKAKQDSYVLKNMKREPRIHQMIKHPNIVQLYETLETENFYYIVMELCLGGDLMDRICDKKKLEEREFGYFGYFGINLGQSVITPNKNNSIYLLL